MLDLKAKPFFLNDQDIEWVHNQLESMSMDEKIGALFCLIAYSSDEQMLKNMVHTYKPGGVMYRPMSLDECMTASRVLQETAKIPMLIAANLEKGGSGVVTEGTMLGSPMQAAATGDLEMGTKLGEICGREGAAVGANWAFAPIIDIDRNFRNPITNTRTFGSCVETVAGMGVNYVKAVQKNGVAASIKHFPGDGIDERDQHLVTSINSLSVEEWDESFGKVYKDCIDAGALTVMIGHIMQPAYSKKLCPGIKDADILPASLSYELTTTLLREKLGFNGLVITDASSMAGMVIPMDRAKAVPATIAAGCDMFLFTRNVDEDYAHMKKGIEDGVITPERLNDALTRILALKASLRLHEKKENGSLIPTKEEAQKILGSQEHKEWAVECADKAITLVKEEKGVLPLTPDKYKKILFYAIESEQGFGYSVKEGVADHFRQMLADEGFTIDVFDPSKGMEGMMRKFSDITDQYDCIIYLANMGTKSNQTVVRIEWALPMGANVPIYINQVPTIFISVENPYHLLDVPRVKTFINAYSSTDAVLEQLIEKLTGRSAFTGKSPVDAFCGMWDTRL